MKTENQTTLAGTIDTLFFQSPTFCTGRIRSDTRELFTFAGKVYVRVGDAVTLRGKWGTHAKYGEQFQCDSAEHTEIVDTAGLAAWLAANAEGIGSRKAERVVKELGDTFSEVLKTTPDHFSKVAGITHEQAIALRDLWASRENVFAVATQLSAFGLSNYQIQTLTEKWGTSAARIVMDDPYVLMFVIDGFGWRKTDEIALKVGVPRNHPSRIAAAIGTAISNRNDNGSTCVGERELLDDVSELLNLDTPDSSKVIMARLVELVSVEKSKVRKVDKIGADGVVGGSVYTSEFSLRDEKVVYEFLKSGGRANPHVHESDVPRLVEAFGVVKVKGKEFTLSDEQKAAVAMTAQHRMSIISGGAGVGKTLLVRAIAEMFRIGQEKTVALAAFTGKAARRIEELAEVSASTIHRLLEYVPGKGGFTRCEENPLERDVVIIDEVSMNDVQLTASLFRAIGPDTSVVFVGDHNQLPAVGAGAILRDAIQRKICPVHILEHCHRQAGALKENCAAILTGEVAPSVPAPASGTASPWMVHRKLDKTEDVLACIEKLFVKHVRDWCFDPLWHVQFMTPIHRGPIGTKAINQLIQRLHQANLGVTVAPVNIEKGPLHLYEGDKIIQTRNNYKLDVMNGTIGVIQSIQGKETVVDFGGKIVIYGSENRGEIEPAYCLTVHKMQGSEVPCAITVVHSSHGFMHHRNWLYTACTRARNSSIIIGNEAGIRGAARKVEIDNRRTLMEVWSNGSEKYSDEIPDSNAEKDS